MRDNMDREFLIEKVKSDNYDKEKLLSWFMSLPKVFTSSHPTEYKVGDVFMHRIFKHPYVLMEKKDDMWICGLFTTDPECDEILCETKSRFFATSYFTRSLFSVNTPTGNFYGTYNNDEHLLSILKKLRKLLK